MDCINQIRHTQNEIRILQQQQQHNPNVLTSPSTLLNNPFSSVNISGTGEATTVKSSTMRRGVLMSILQQAALTLPLWVGEIGQSAPPL